MLLLGALRRRRRGRSNNGNGGGSTPPTITSFLFLGEWENNRNDSDTPVAINRDGTSTSNVIAYASTGPNAKIYRHSGIYNNYITYSGDTLGINVDAIDISLNGDGTILAYATSEASTRVSNLTIKKWGTLTPIGNISLTNRYGATVGPPRISLNSAGDRIAVGEPDSVNTVKVFQRLGTTSTWTQLGNTITGQNGEGHGVHLNNTGDILATCSRDSVKIYRLINNTWTQIGLTKVVNADTSISRKRTIKISDDGMVFSVDMGNDAGLGGIYMFNVNDNTWYKYNTAAENIWVLNSAGNIASSGQDYYAFYNSGWQSLGQIPLGTDSYVLDMNSSGSVLIVGNGQTSNYSVRVIHAQGIQES
jgi:hypothetical protein